MESLTQKVGKVGNAIEEILDRIKILENDKFVPWREYDERKNSLMNALIGGLQTFYELHHEAEQTALKHEIYILEQMEDLGDATPSTRFEYAKVTETYALKRWRAL